MSGYPSRDERFREHYLTLRQRAAHFLRKFGPVPTLPPTALLNEAYMRLARTRGEVAATSSRFLAVAVRAVKHALIDYLREKKRTKRPQQSHREPLHEELVETPRGISIEEIDLRDAIAEFRKIDSRGAEIIELRHFKAMTFDEIAEKMNMSATSVRRNARHARAWLYGRLSP